MGRGANEQTADSILVLRIYPLGTKPKKILNSLSCYSVGKVLIYCQSGYKEVSAIPDSAQPAEVEQVAQAHDKRAVYD